MPLAIVQATSYISRRAPRSSVRQYLEQFRKNDRKKASLLDYVGGELRRDREAKNSIIITWQISFEHIRQLRPSAADLLSLMSFCEQQGIPENLIRRRSGHDLLQHDRVESSDNEHSDAFSDGSSAGGGFEDDIQVLRNYSFISPSGSGAFEMHRLVQLATRKWLELHGQLEKYNQQFRRNLAEKHPDGEYENWAKCRELYPHAQSAAAQVPKEVESRKYWASILRVAAWYADMIGNTTDAERMSIQAMEMSNKVFGPEDPMTVNMWNWW
jgi:hypothetical protein